MDIRCPSCDTAYAFDTSPFGPDGVNVRCPFCKAVFRAAASAPQLLVVWYALRPTTGMTQEATGTAELQRLAIQGLIAGDDLISNDRVNWQRADALPSLRHLLSSGTASGQGAGAATNTGPLARTGSHESFVPLGWVTQVTEGAASVAAALPTANPPWPDRHTTSPAPTIATAGTSPVAALNDAATRNMHPLADEQLGGEPGGFISSTSGTMAPRTTAPIPTDGRFTTAVSPAAIASQQLQPVDPITSPNLSLPHSAGSSPHVARRDNPAMSTSQFSVAPDPQAFASAAAAEAAPAPVAPQQSPPAAPMVPPPSPAFATQVMAVHDVEAATMRSTFSQSRAYSTPATSPDAASFLPPSAAPPRPEPTPSLTPVALTQTMRTSPATRPPDSVSPPPAPAPLLANSVVAPVAAATAFPHVQRPTPPLAPPPLATPPLATPPLAPPPLASPPLAPPPVHTPQQALYADAPASSPPPPVPAQQLKALRADGSRPLPDRYTLGRTGLDDNQDEWRVGDKPMELPHEPGDGRAPRSETLDVPQISRPKPIYKVLGVAALIAVVAVAAIVMNRPSLQTEADAEGSAASADSGVAGSTADAGMVLVNQAAADGSTDGARAAGEASAGEAAAGEASAGEAAAAAPPIAPVTAEVGSVNNAAPTRRPAPAQPAENDYDALMEQAERALSARRYNEAVDLFAAATEQSNRAEAHVGAGRAYAGLRQWHVATARFQRAIDRNPRYMPAWYELGNARSQSGDSTGALAAWQQVVDESRDQQLVRRAQSAIDGAQ